MVNHLPASGYIRIGNKYALGRDKHSERQICPEMVCEAAICRQHGRICNTSFLVIDGLNSTATDRVNIEYNLGERHLKNYFAVFKKMFMSIHMDTSIVVLGIKWAKWSNNVFITGPDNTSVHVEMIHFNVYFIMSYTHFPVAICLFIFIVWLLYILCLLEESQSFYAIVCW